MKITFANQRVAKFFQDYTAMQKKLPLDWVRTIKKHMNHLKSAETFGDFLSLGLGHPEGLEGSDKGKYSLHVNGNVRLIIQPNAEGTSVMVCEEINVKGVCDYHGDKSNWYIP